MDTTVGALKVGAQLVMGKYGVDKDNPYPIVWLKGNPNCDLVIGYMAGGGSNLKSKFTKLRNSNVSIDVAATAMRKELTSTQLGVQYAFLTEKALSKLVRVSTEIVEMED